MKTLKKEAAKKSESLPMVEENELLTAENRCTPLRELEEDEEEMVEGVV